MHVLRLQVERAKNPLNSRALDILLTLCTICDLVKMAAALALGGTRILEGKIIYFKLFMLLSP